MPHDKIQALEIIEAALDRVLLDGPPGWSPFTGHPAYLCLCHARQAVYFPDVEVYEGQRRRERGRCW